MRLILSILILFAVGCGNQDEVADDLRPSAVAVVATEIAVATMQPDAIQRVPRSQCTICGGTGRVKAGDTVTVVWHDCENCFDDTPASEPVEEPVVEEPVDILAGGRERRVLVFTASWCGPCQAMKGDLLPLEETKTRTAPLTILKYNGWEVGHAVTDQIQLVDIDDHPEMMERFGFVEIPLCICYVNDREIARHQGPMDQWEIGKLYDTPAPESVIEQPTEEPVEEPGAWRLGYMDEIEPKIEQLRALLTLLGGRGSIEVRPDCDGVCLVEWPISPVVSLRLTTPIVVGYVLHESGNITLTFDKPIPVRYRFLRGDVTAVEISTDQVEVKIDGLPDGFFQIRS